MHTSNIFERLRNPYPTRQDSDIGNEADISHKLNLVPDFANSATKFEQSQLAIMQQTLGNVATFQLPSSRTHEFKWDVTVIPKGPTGKRGTQGQSTGYALTKLSKNPDSAWEWDKFITNKENGVLHAGNGETAWPEGGDPAGKAVPIAPTLLIPKPCVTARCRSSFNA